MRPKSTRNTDPAPTRAWSISSVVFFLVSRLITFGAPSDLHHGKLDRKSGAHRGGDGNALDVGALGGLGLGLDDRADERHDVFFQGLGRERSEEHTSELQSRQYL